MEKKITINGESLNLTLDQAKEWNSITEKTCYICDTFGVSLIGYTYDGYEIDQSWMVNFIEKHLERLLIKTNTPHKSFWF